MKLLFLMQGRQVADHPGFHDAFLKLMDEGLLSSYDVIPYFGFAEKHGWNAFYEEVVRRVKLHEVDVVFFQFFHSPATPSPRKCIAALRRLKSNPLIVVSSGDAFSINPLDKRCFPKCFCEAASMADLTFMTAMGRCAEFMAGQGARNIIFLPNAVCQSRASLNDSLKGLDAESEYDVGFVGSNLQCRHPFQFMMRRYCAQRNKIVSTLYRRYGKRFAVYGKGWDRHPCAKGVFPFNHQALLGQKARIIFGGYPGSTERYYTSDRVFFQGVSGATFVDWYVPGVDRFLRDGEHWYLCEDCEAVVRTIDRLLEMDPSVLRQRAEARIRYLFAKHTQYHRMKFLIQTVRACREAHCHGLLAPKPEFDFFLPEVDVKQESQHALCNWVG